MIFHQLDFSYSPARRVRGYRLARHGWRAAAFLARLGTPMTLIDGMPAWSDVACYHAWHLFIYRGAFCAEHVTAGWLWWLHVLLYVIMRRYFSPA